eukprot:scaffold579_cov146-Ochromonas_danica.AAC.2
MNLEETSSSTSSNVLPRLDDQQRLQRLLDDINTRNSSKRVAPYEFDDSARALLVEYAAELTKSLISASSLVASHRGSMIIEEKDISMILAKKMGIEMTGFELAPVLHHYSFKTALDSVEKSCKRSAESSSQEPRLLGKRKSAQDEEDS